MYTLADIFEGNYPVSQAFGNNPAYYSQFGFKGHEGVDWATPNGVKVFAPFDAVVVRDNDNPKGDNYGEYVVLWDPAQKCAVWFCHLKENYVSVNQQVKKGDVIGLTDNTGNTTGPHLHVNFCETDAIGYRINTGNGYKGFLNILDPQLVKWVLSQNPNPPAGADMYNGYDLNNKESMKVAVDVMRKVLNHEYVPAADVAAISQKNAELQTAIDDKNKKIALANVECQKIADQANALVGQL